MKHSISLVSSNILPQVKIKHQKLFQFGISAFSLSSFTSLNSNARTVIENVNTASSKVYRLVSNEGILKDFNTLLKNSKLVHEKSLVNVDFSTFCGFETLAFATQTQSGRAIPVWANCITYPVEEVGSQNIFVLAQIELFASVLGFYPSFVFDRGFWIPDMMKFFLNGHIPFYLRIKKGNYFEVTNTSSNTSGKPGKPKKLKAVKIGDFSKDTTVTIFKHKMRLIVSPPPPKVKIKNKKQSKERWYILTNDFDSTREDILDIYRHRFEIEETFKDVKHVCDLKKFFISKILTFRILLWFFCLSFWLAYWCSLTKQLSSIYFPNYVHPKKKRSYFKIWWEEIQRLVKKPSLDLTNKAWSG